MTLGEYEDDIDTTGNAIRCNTGQRKVRGFDMRELQPCATHCNA